MAMTAPRAAPSPGRGIMARIPPTQRIAAMTKANGLRSAAWAASRISPGLSTATHMPAARSPQRNPKALKPSRILAKASCR